MSMISAQIDGLRERAKVLRQGRWSDGADDAKLMEDAADTITELRGALQVASVDYRHLSAENAKLRELVDGWDFCSKTKSSTFDNCVGCPLFIQTPHSYRCARDERMRELGIEVDE